MIKTVEPLESNVCNKVLKCQFGEIEYDERNIVLFPEGLCGFEQYKKYILWESKKYIPFIWLICVEKPDLKFPIIDPHVIYPAYNPILQDIESWDILLAVVTIGEAVDSVTMNLRAPIFINEEEHRGKQIILAENRYPLQYKVVH